MTRPVLCAVVCLGFIGTLAGCARAALDTTGFALIESATYDASFVDTWQATKRELRALDLDIYTRDKRGVFVAFTQQGRAVWLQPQREKFTIRVEETAAGRTAVEIETVAQVYGVTLLTYPDWHERQARNTNTAQAILEGVAVRLGAEPLGAPEIPETTIETLSPAEPAPFEEIDADPVDRP